MSWHVDGRRRNRKPNSMNRKPKTTSDTKSEKPLVLLLKTENQMPKKAKTVNLNRRQNGKTEGFRWKSQLKISPKPKRKPFWVYSSLLVWHKCYGNKEQTNTYCYCWDYFFFHYNYNKRVNLRICSCLACVYRVMVHAGSLESTKDA